MTKVLIFCVRVPRMHRQVLRNAIRATAIFVTGTSITAIGENNQITRFIFRPEELAVIRHMLHGFFQWCASSTLLSNQS